MLSLDSALYFTDPKLPLSTPKPLDTGMLITKEDLSELSFFFLHSTMS